MITKLTETKCQDNKPHIPVTDEHRGEIFCQKCAQVLAERIVCDELHLLEVTESHMAINLGQTTLISKKTSDIPYKARPQYYKIRKMENRIKIASGQKEQSRIILTIGICDQLKLPKAVQADILKIMTKLKKGRWTSGHVIKELLAASTLYVCRKYAIPKSMDDISIATEIPKKKIFQALKLVIDMYGPIQAVQPIESYVPQYASRVGLNPYQQKEVFRLLEKIKNNDDNHVGKSPIVVIGSIILHMARTSDDFHMTKTKIADLLNISDVGLQNMIKRFSVVLGD